MNGENLDKVLERMAKKALDIERLIALQNAGLEASAEVRQAVNEAIDKHDLSPDETLCMFSRLAASYIHTMQSSCPDANSRDAVEDLFLDMLDKYLALLDTQEVKDAMEREKRRKMN